jgi:hypothetical protein
VLSLNEVLRKYAEQGSDALESAVDEIVQLGYLAEYLHDLLEGPKSSYASQFPVGYRHPNGFTKIRLAELSDYGWAIRLHVWAEQSADDNIHSHRWKFASRILSGSLIEETYDITAEAGEYAKYYCAPSVQGRYSLSFQHNCDVRPVGRDLYQPGASYARDAKTLHMAFADSTSRVVTLFVQGSEQATFTTVIRGPRSDVNSNVVAPRCSKAELKELLQEVAGLIARG